MKFCSVNKYNLKSARCKDSWIRHGLKMCTHVTLLVLHFAVWCTQAYGVQDKLDVTCIDLYLCDIYVFVYLHVTCGHYIKLESSMICDMCYMFSHCIYFFCIFILSCWTICRYKYMGYWMVYRYMLGNRTYVTKN